MNTPNREHYVDKLLVDRVLRGDTQAFGIIIQNTQCLVAQIVHRMIRGAEDRKDIAQDVYLRAFHKLGSFKFEARLSTWIGQIAYNSCLSWLDKKKNADIREAVFHRSAGAFQDETEKQFSQKELSSILKTEVGNLPPLYQLLITLFHHEMLSYVEMGQITGLPEGTLKSYLFRARKQLKENLLSKYKKEAL
ncbi:MAG: sigma-70 family RNA polymerase sigma factor [Bacteroidota bacterium]|nr:sigma-70 family RNA polymerase sigma factor [Bacteroidota bacterium]MDP4216779.1 sigma-70 family RNA polymerase sigma factor [Bacteroidota bacterium]MDP4246981.1 sigma-70 family RNA polymerase sigma factor [Bacteroidota bacterium]MDP4252641.1 sigma-70 family RNA polymerase sigma factor [Bacteroidota bacterium]MDP4258506.1 sigma-70 family RNA polymerase sigma factor [Bacteroidota bacterium]